MTSAGILSVDGPHGAWAWLALRIDSANESVAYASRADHRAEASAAETAWLHGRWDVSNGVRMELRYLSGADGTMTCALLGRVHGPDLDAAITAATGLRTRLGHVPPHVRSSPVESDPEVRDLLTPFPTHPDGLAEIRKRIHVGRPVRPDAQVGYYLAVTPFPTVAAAWEPLWKAIADQPAPIMLTIGLEPTVPSPTFGPMIATLAHNYRRLGTPGRLPDGLFGPGAPLMPDPFAASAMHLFEDASRRYTSRAFRIRITLASPAPLPAYLIDQAATAICPPRPDGGRTYVVVRPSAAEFGIATNNLSALDQHRWDSAYLRDLPEPPPDVIRSLAEYVDAPEAASSWRFPLAAGVTVRPYHVEINVTGDFFYNTGDNVTMINKSTLTNSLNAARATAGEDVATSIDAVSKVVEASGDSDATDNFNAFTDELSKPDPKKSMLKTFWNGVSMSLGHLPEVISAGETIRKLFE